MPRRLHRRRKEPRQQHRQHARAYLRPNSLLRQVYNAVVCGSRRRLGWNGGVSFGISRFLSFLSETIQLWSHAEQNVAERKGPTTCSLVNHWYRYGFGLRFEERCNSVILLRYWVIVEKTTIIDPSTTETFQKCVLARRYVEERKPPAERSLVTIVTNHSLGFCVTSSHRLLWSQVYSRGAN